MSVVRRGSVGGFAEADDRIVVGVHTTSCTSGIVTIHIRKQVKYNMAYGVGILEASRRCF